jgi:hypothetical protein
MVRLRRVCVAAVGVWAACGGGRPISPAPVRGLAPDERALAEQQAADELIRWKRERDERWLEAVDPGESAEHARRVKQADIDLGKASVAEIFRQGETIFERRFTVGEGLGTGMLGRPRPGLSRVENGAELGGPDALSCRECHGRGGDDGHGELHQRAFLDGDGRHLGSARPRLPPHVAGAGLTELLAREISDELQKEVAAGKEIARASHGDSKVLLASKGVSFGELTVRADGTVDNSGIRGIDRDLVVRPFGWKGTSDSLRTFVRRALPQHLGLEPPSLLAAVGPPSTIPLADGDRDGIANELHDGQLTSLVAYLALLDVPQILPPGDPELAQRWSRGATRFREIGCAECHRPELPLHATRFTDGKLTIDLLRDNQVPPRAEQADYVRDLGVRLFSDLRRHDLGPALADRSEHGVSERYFLTRPLWGLGDRGPYYMHDGRARSLGDAIRLHGGEAQAAADGYAKLATDEKREIDLFLLSLRRAPQGRISP